VKERVFGEEFVASTRADKCDVNAECTRWFCVLCKASSTSPRAMFDQKYNACTGFS